MSKFQSKFPLKTIIYQHSVSSCKCRLAKCDWDIHGTCPRAQEITDKSRLESGNRWSLFFTVVPCIFILSKSFIYQLMHKRVALKIF